MTIKESLIFSNNKLKGLDPHFLEGEILLSFILKKPKEHLCSHLELKLTNIQLKKFKNLVSRRLKKEPIAYLIKQKEFYGLNFYVDKNVLTPRPETELIVDEVLKTITPNQKPITIIDVGTGSGCIAITLAKLIPKAKIIATDISQKALTVVKKNAKNNGVLENIRFIKSNLFFKIQNSKFKIIIANLPYLTKKELKNVSYEPRTSLYGGKEGLIYIEKLLSRVKNYLKPNGIIFLEISPTQTKKILTLAKKYLPNKKIIIINDLNKRERVVKIIN